MLYDQNTLEKQESLTSLALVSRNGNYIDIMKVPPGVTLPDSEDKSMQQLRQLAADQKRATELLKRILDRQIVYRVPTKPKS
jgi:hypothetical protein